MSDPSASPFHVLIIGAGSCGLAIAQGLRKSNISFTVVERDTENDYIHRPRDWGFLLHWGAPYLQKCLPPELWERRQEMYVDPWHDWSSNSTSLIWNAKTGEEILRPQGEATVRLSRRKIRALLRGGLDIKYEKRLKDITSGDAGVTAHFEDGSSATGSLLIGCDGGRSKAREFLVGSEAAKGFDTDYTMINTSWTVPAKTALGLRAKHPIISQAMHPDSRVGALMAVLDRPAEDSPPETWKFQIYTGWNGAPRKADLVDPAVTREFWKSRFEQMIEPFHSAGLAIPEDFVLPVDDGRNFKPLGDFEWNKYGGRVTIAGDAAHSMLPHRGQGLNNAMMDAGQIVEAIKRVVEAGSSLADAVKAYEDEMRPRGSNEVELSLETMRTSAVRAFNKSPLKNMGFHRPRDLESTPKLS